MCFIFYRVPVTHRPVCYLGNGTNFTCIDSNESHLPHSVNTEIGTQKEKRGKIIAGREARKVETEKVGSLKGSSLNSYLPRSGE